MGIYFLIKGHNICLSKKADYIVICSIGALLAFHWTAFYTSVQVSTVAIALITFSAYPIFVTFFEPLMFRERLKKADAFFALIMFMGVLIIVPELNIENNLTVGLLWGLAGSVSFAVMSLLNRKFASSYDGSVIAFYEQGVAALVLIIGYMTSHRKNAKKLGVQLAVIAAAAAVMQLPAMKNLFSMVNVPMATFGVVALLCLFNVVIMRTRLGQQFRAVGQNGVVANAAGIDVDRVRIIAIVFSTILAGWGQLIFVQNMGSFQTYGAHEQVGLYAGAAILVGGASVIRATNTQALVGCVLFHLMFVVSPMAGKELIGQAQLGEYFRVFVSYGIIALALVLHAWRRQRDKIEARRSLRGE